MEIKSSIKAAIKKKSNNSKLTGQAIWYLIFYHNGHESLHWDKISDLI